MEYRAARPEDYDAMVLLANANYIENLTPEQRRDGFLSVRFVRDDFVRMAGEVGIAAAFEDGALAGFLCAETIDKAGMPPVLARTAQCFRDSHFQGKPGHEWKSFLAGPLCIAEAFRGQGVRHGLHKALLAMVQGNYEVGVSFIAFENSRSYHGATAHEGHGGLDEVASFELNGQHYHVLAFKVEQ
ncbi:MAG TPA: hypothetical protein VJN94_13560 [Candidatus Binataceae bacterium]|nr:hypothetical protein [Candidatus Binataceae bacterium]